MPQGGNQDLEGKRASVKNQDLEDKTTSKREFAYDDKGASRRKSGPRGQRNLGL